MFSGGLVKNEPLSPAMENDEDSKKNQHLSAFKPDSDYSINCHHKNTIDGQSRYVTRSLSPLTFEIKHRMA